MVPDPEQPYSIENEEKEAMKELLSDPNEVKDELCMICAMIPCLCTLTLLVEEGLTMGILTLEPVPTPGNGQGQGGEHVPSPRAR